MHEHKPEQKRQLLGSRSQESQESLPDVIFQVINTLGEGASIDIVNGVYSLSSESFELSIVQRGYVLEIRNIEVFEQGQGLGTHIIEVLQEAAEEFDLELIASHVRDEAISFWEAVGFQKGVEDGEYFLPS